MERKLLLLGLLMNAEMHGYQLYEVIDAHLGSSVQLKKSLVYKMLNDMATEGWLAFTEEQVGNRPPRRVYTITDEGSAAFHDLLRNSLEQYKPADFLGHIAIGYIDMLPANEVLPLLQKRRAALAAVQASAKEQEIHPGSMQLILDHQVHHLTAELEWLDKVIGQVEEAPYENDE